MGSSSGDEQFCLRWNDYQDSITESLHHFRSDRDFLDVSIWCGEDEKQISAHRVVLSACSSFFKRILKKNPNPNPVIVLWDVSVEDLETILAFMYNGEVKVRQEQLNSFLGVAERLRVRGLCQQKEGNSNHHLDSPPPSSRPNAGGGGRSNNASSNNRRPPRPRSMTPPSSRSPKRVCKSPPPPSSNKIHHHSDAGHDMSAPEPDVEIKEERGLMSHHNEEDSMMSHGGGEGGPGSNEGVEGDYSEYGYGGMNESAWGSPGGANRGHRLSSSDSYGNNPRRPRSVYTTQQLTQLEAYFRFNEYIDGDRKKQLSIITQIPEHQIKVWFQNRRQKKKRELDETGGAGDAGGMTNSPAGAGTGGDRKPVALE